MDYAQLQLEYPHAWKIFKQYFNETVSEIVVIRHSKTSSPYYVSARSKFHLLPFPLTLGICITFFEKQDICLVLPGSYLSKDDERDVYNGLIEVGFMALEQKITSKLKSIQS